MSEQVPSLLRAQGERVHVSVASAADVGPYRTAMTRSAARIGRWNPVNSDDLTHHLAAQSDKHRTFLIRANDDERLPDDPGLVGCVNVTNAVQGRFMNATMGYNAFDPYVGRGLFREGLALTVGIALRPAPGGMGLHRIEANVRIGNDASAGTLRALGFRRERSIRRMLWLADGVGGPSAWRDHDSFAVTREEWPAPRHAANDLAHGVVVCGETVSAPTAVAVARELGGVALTAIAFDAALTTARYAGAPIIWIAGEHADDAVRALTSAGVQNCRGDDALEGIGSDPAQVIAASLRLRSRLA